MGTYILKRLGQVLIVLVLLSLFVFLLLSFMPGDPVYAMLGEDITQEEYDVAFKELGLDKPVMERYFTWLTNVFQGDFGKSYQFHKPVMEVLGSRLPATLWFSFTALIISTAIGIVFGVICAVFRGKVVDTVVTLIANVCSCVPQFWVGILLMYIFSLKLGWLPSFGFAFPWDDFQKATETYILPIICLCLSPLASTTRQTRSSMLEVIRQDYIMTARSKGVKEIKVIILHALKNGLIPILSLMGMRIAQLVGGAVFVETVFVIPGMGNLMISSVTFRDVPMVQACCLLTAAVACLANLVIDILYAVVDPRIRFTEGE